MMGDRYLRASLKCGASVVKNEQIKGQKVCSVNACVWLLFSFVLFRLFRAQKYGNVVKKCVFFVQIIHKMYLNCKVLFELLIVWWLLQSGCKVPVKPKPKLCLRSCYNVELVHEATRTRSPDMQRKQRLLWVTALMRVFRSDVTDVSDMRRWRSGKQETWWHHSSEGRSLF